MDEKLATSTLLIDGEISRLETVVWREETGYANPFWVYLENEKHTRPVIHNCEPLVRRSDAEAIIAKQAARIAELEAVGEPVGSEHQCWCETCRPITIGDMRMVLCPECGNKRCPHATDHRNPCTGSNEPGQK